MITFGLNRPVYSFGLGLGFSVLVLLSGGECAFPVEDSRDFLVKHAAEIQVQDIRINEVYNNRIIEVMHVNEFRVDSDRVTLVTDNRIFVIESDRYFIVKRDCNA